MKKLVKSMLLLSFLFLLAACAEEDLMKDELLEKVIEKADDVKSYSKILEERMDEETPTDTIYVLSKEESTLNEELEEWKYKWEYEVQDSARLDGGSHIEKVELYQKDKARYSQSNDKGWIEANTPPGGVITVSAYTYHPVVWYLQDLDGKLELDFSSEKGHYLFTYKGISQLDYKELIQNDFTTSLITTSFDESEVEHDIKIRVDKKSLYIVDINHKILAENAEGKVEATSKLIISDINKVKEVKVPKEVLDSAKVRGSE